MSFLAQIEGLSGNGQNQKVSVLQLEVEEKKPSSIWAWPSIASN